MTGTVQVYDHFTEISGDGTLDFDNDTFSLELYNSSHSFISTHTQRSDISANALATGFGYTNPGFTLTSVTFVRVGNVTTFDSADVLWNAVGGTIGPANFAVLRDVTADKLIATLNFQSAFQATDGTPFLIAAPSGGWFSVVAA